MCCCGGLPPDVDRECLYLCHAFVAESLAQFMSSTCHKYLRSVDNIPLQVAVSAVVEVCTQSLLAVQAAGTQSLFQKMDVNQDGVIDRREFDAAMGNALNSVSAMQTAANETAVDPPAVPDVGAQLQQKIEALQRKLDN